MVCYTPIDKKRPLVFLSWGFLQIVSTKISNFIPSLTLLDLPTSEIRVHE